MKSSRSHQPSRASGNLEDYDRLFLAHVHRLIKLAYDRLVPASYARAQETAITGFLAEEIERHARQANPPLDALLYRLRRSARQRTKDAAAEAIRPIAKAGRYTPGLLGNVTACPLPLRVQALRDRATRRAHTSGRMGWGVS